MSLAEMYAADEVFCTGTMGEIAGVTEIDGRPIGDGTVGPVTADVVARLYQAHAPGERRTRCSDRQSSVRGQLVVVRPGRARPGGAGGPGTPAGVGS